MPLFRSRRKILFLAICWVGATFIGAVVFGQTTSQPSDKKGVNRPKIKTTKHTIEQAQLQVENGKKAISSKPFTLADVEKRLGKKLNPDDVLTLPNKKKVAVSKLLAAAQKTESKLNEHGYTMSGKQPNTLPKGGVQFSLRGKPDATVFAKQRATITSAHHKAAADKVQQVNASVAMLSKAQAPALLKTARENQDKIEKFQQAQIDKFKKIDPKKLTADDLKLYHHIEDVLKKKKATPDTAKVEKHDVVATRIQKEAKTTADLVRNVRISDAILKGIFTDLFANFLNYDRVQTFPWALGSKNVAEIDVTGSLEVHGHDGNFGSSLHTRGSLHVGSSILSHGFTVLDAVADLASTKSSSASSTQFQLSAKFFGDDIFPAINETLPTNTKHVDKKHPFDFTIVEGDVVIVIVPIHYAVGVKGEVHFLVDGVLSPTLVSANPTLDVSVALYASASIDLEEFRAGVRGTLNLVHENLQLFGSVALQFHSGPLSGAIPPHLDIQFSVHDKLTLLGGEVDLFAEAFDLNPFSDHFLEFVEIGHVALFSIPGFTPVDGFLFGPDHINIPQPLATTSK